MQIRTDNTETLKNALKRIEELEKACNETQELLDKQIEATLKLDKENAELAKENSYYKDIIETNSAEWEEQGRRIVDLEKANATLKKEVDLWKKASENNSFKAFQFEKENKELKGNFKITKDNENEYSSLLTKAKEIIKELVRVEYADFTNGDYSNELSKVLEQAEQFIKDSEVEK